MMKRLRSWYHLLVFLVSLLYFFSVVIVHHDLHREWKNTSLVYILYYYCSRISAKAKHKAKQKKKQKQKKNNPAKTSFEVTITHKK